MIHQTESKKKVVSLVLFLFLNGAFLNAQQPLNFDFEIQSIEGVARPWGWYIATWGETSFTMDSTNKHSGKYSLKTECQRTDSCMQQSYRFDIEPYELRGHLLEATGYVKTEGLEGSLSISLGYAVLVEDHGYIETEIASRICNGSFDWDTISVKLSIPENAGVLFLKINYIGSGKAWLDDITLKREGKEIREVTVAKAFSEKQLKWLKKNSFSLISLSPAQEKTNDADLSSFKQSVGESRIVALGESTHGTSEFFTLKHRLLEYLVTDLDFRIFAIEDNQLAIETVNEYVLSGTGTAFESMRNMFAVWNTLEVVALVEWVRKYNIAHAYDPVYFVGFDVQEIARPVEALSAFLMKYDPALFKIYDNYLNELNEKENTIYYTDEETKIKWFNASKSLLDTLNIQKKEWYSNALNQKDSTDVLIGIQYGKLVNQFCENLYKGHWSLFRDEAMAENIGWILNERYPNSKMVIWAHDGHISKGKHPNSNYNLNFSISMGSFLTKKFGDNYKAYSLSTYKGFYSALISYTNYDKIQSPLYPAPIGSLDEALHHIAVKNKYNALFLPLDPKIEWLSEPQPKRFANHVSIDYGYYERISLPHQFDGVFFIDTTTGSIPITD